VGDHAVGEADRGDTRTDLQVGVEAGLPRLVGNEFQRRHQANAPDSTDERMVGEALAQPLLEIAAGFGRVPGQVLAIDDVEIGFDRCGSHGMSGIGPAVADRSRASALFQNRPDLLANDYSGQRKIAAG
jgi:hypothetical protein